MLAHGAAICSRWYLATGGSSGNEPSAASNRYFFALAHGSPLSFTALWERWDEGEESLESFTITTTAASAGLADIHRR